MKCFTWNTQGDFTNTDKWKIIKDLFEKSDCEVGMIQEGGNVGYQINGLGFSSWSRGKTPGSYNERCTNYIVSTLDGVEYYLNACGGGVAGRQAAALLIKGVLYVSWHSTAVCGLDDDTSALVNEIVSDMKMGLIDAAVIGGDFNTTQANIERIAESRTRRTDIGYSVKTSKEITQVSGKKLDYFLIIHDSNFNANLTAKRIDAQPSDHWPVMSKFNI